MNYENLEKQVKIFGQIKELDQQISQLNEFAVLVANDDRKLVVKIEFQKQAAPKDSDHYLDAIRSTMSRSMGIPCEIVMFHSRESVNTTRTSIDTVQDDVNDVEALCVIQLILDLKNKKRGFLHTQLVDLQKILQV